MKKRVRRTLNYGDGDAPKPKQRRTRLPPELWQQVASRLHDYDDVLNYCESMQISLENMDTCEDLLFWFEWVRNAFPPNPDGRFRKALVEAAFGRTLISGRIGRPRTIINIPRIRTLMPVLNDTLVARLSLTYNVRVLSQPFLAVFHDVGRSPEAQTSYETQMLPQFVVRMMSNAQQLLRDSLPARYGDMYVLGINDAVPGRRIPTQPYHDQNDHPVDLSQVSCTIHYGVDQSISNEQLQPLCEWWWIVLDDIVGVNADGRLLSFDVQRLQRLGLPDVPDHVSYELPPNPTELDHIYTSGFQFDLRSIEVQFMNGYWMDLCSIGLHTRPDGQTERMFSFPPQTPAPWFHFPPLSAPAVIASEWRRRLPDQAPTPLPSTPSSRPST